jgi:glycerol-3-phosphate dehydrogenase
MTSWTARNLANRVGVDMPITSEVAAVLHDRKPPRTAVNDLLARDIGAER